MEFTQLTIQDALLIKPNIIKDDRGFFVETYSQNKFFQVGIPYYFIRDNHSGSKKGVLRGLHFCITAQGKLVRVNMGEVFDVVVDLRPTSPTFKKWEGISLSHENKYEVWIPPGCAHGFYVLSDWAEVAYKMTDYWSFEDERTLLWNDPTIAIDWPIPQGQIPLLSDKDAKGTLLENLNLSMI